MNAQMTYNERYAFLRELLCDECFIQKKYAGGEIPNYICAFPPEEAARYREMAQELRKDLTQKGANALLLDVYEVMIAMLKDSGSLDDYLAAPGLTHKEIMEYFAGVLDNDSEFAPKVAAIIGETGADIHRDFKATARNLAILLLKDFDENPAALAKKTEAARRHCAIQEHSRAA